MGFQAGLAYDEADGYVLGYAPDEWSSPPGYNGYCTNNTWTYHNGLWINLSIPGPTVPCSGSTIAYYPPGSAVLLYSPLASEGDNNSLNATWEYSHGVWTDLDLVSPPSRVSSQMAYDAQLGVMVLFGGQDTATDALSNQTWEFGEAGWTQLDSPHAPPARDDFGLAYDGATGTVVLYGGMGSGRMLSDTWEFDGKDWTPEASPSGTGVDAPSAAYDPAIGGVVVFGGWVPPYNYQNSTWVYSGKAWAEHTGESPPGRSGAAVVFDESDGYLLLRGGLDMGSPSGYYAFGDTWAFETPGMFLDLHISASPGTVCALSAPACPVSTTTSRVTLSVDVVNATVNLSVLRAAPSAVLVYGPISWIPEPRVDFVPYGNVQVSPTPDFAVSCATLGFGIAPGCPSDPNISAVGPSASPDLAWTWDPGGGDPQLTLGSQWTLSFNVVVSAPPDGQVPIDLCTAVDCRSAEAGPPSTAATALTSSAGRDGNHLTFSFPLGLIGVEAPTTVNQPPPPNGVPPPPPAGPALPLPVVSSPVTQPVASPIAITATAGTAFVSVQALSAGVLAAGFAAATLRSRASALRNPVPLRTGGRREHRRPPRRADE